MTDRHVDGEGGAEGTESRRMQRINDQELLDNLLAYARRFVRSEDAREVVQSAMLDFLENPGARSESVTTQETHARLHRKVKNLALNLLRKKENEAKALAHVGGLVNEYQARNISMPVVHSVQISSRPDIAYDHAQLWGAIDKVIPTLQPRQAEAFTLFYVVGLKPGAIATRMKTTADNVRALRVRAVRTVVTELRKMGIILTGEIPRAPGSTKEGDA